MMFTAIITLGVCVFFTARLAITTMVVNDMNTKELSNPELFRRHHYVKKPTLVSGYIALPFLIVSLGIIFGGLFR